MLYIISDSFGNLNLSRSLKQLSQLTRVIEISDYVPYTVESAAISKRSRSGDFSVEYGEFSLMPIIGVEN